MAVQDELQLHHEFLLPLAVRTLSLLATTKLIAILWSHSVISLRESSNVAASTKSASKFTRKRFENIPQLIGEWVWNDDVMGAALAEMELEKALHHLSGIFNCIEEVRVVAADDRVPDDTSRMCREMVWCTACHVKHEHPVSVFASPCPSSAPDLTGTRANIRRVYEEC